MTQEAAVLKKRNVSTIYYKERIMRSSARVALGLMLCLCGLAAAQINVKGFSSRSVRTGDYAATIIDSLLVETEVGYGQARTTVTMILAPAQHIPYHWEETDSLVCYEEEIYGVNDAITIRESCYPYRAQVWEEPAPLDSVEITGHFRLPEDYVATDMYLWVEGEPQRAYVQDRSLAWEQYSNIVGVRRDPALLEYWGAGSYNLRIFPAKSLHSRKIAIEFRHTFDDESLDQIAASVPVLFDSSYTSYRQPPGIHETIGYVRVMFSSNDGKRYAVAMPGVGAGDFDNAPLVIERRDIEHVGAATVYAGDPSGSDEYFWQGTDKHNVRTAGFEVMLAESTVDLEPEPETRIIVLDMREEVWDADDYRKAFNEYYYQQYPGTINFRKSNRVVDIWNRARKLAVLCIDNYVKEGQKFNLIINGEQPIAVFDSPKSRKEGRALAVQAVLGAKTHAGASTENAVKAGLAAAGDGIVILISDLYQPYNASKIVYEGDRYQGIKLSSAGERYENMMQRIDSLVSNSPALFYTVADEGRLNQTARASGGFQLGALRHDYYMRYETVMVDDKAYYRPIMPDLFMDNYQGLVITEVASNDFTDIAYTADGYNSWWWGPVMMEDAVVRKTASPLAKTSMVWPGYLPNQRVLRFAGALKTQSGNQTVSVTIKGRLGGLAFTKSVHGRIGLFNMDNSSVQHAFRTSEYLASENWRENASQIKALGLDHHMITRQTALLALEPGVEPYKDTAVAEQNGREAGASLASDDAKSSSYQAEPGGQTVSIDSMSLEELIDQTVSVDQKAPKTSSVREFGVRAAGRRLMITMPSAVDAAVVKVRLYDLRGRLVASEELDASRAVNGALEWNLNGVRLGSSHHVLKISTAKAEKVFKVFITQ